MKSWSVAALLSLALALPGAVSAQTLADYDYENLAFRGIGVDFGAVWPAQVEPTLSFGVRADMGYVGPHVRISPAIRFWSSSLRVEEVERLADQILLICEKQAAASCPSSLDLGEVDRSDLELSVDAHYLFNTGYTISPYLGGGLGLHLLNGQGEFINGTFVEDLLDTIVPGVNAIAGLNIPLGESLQILAEARYVLVSDVRFGYLGVGGVWNLPTNSGQ
ncbi:MAG TPA: hypothetical protein VFI91_03280 [Longimicrobiaceae bacterium]|nr:hypothetical protein [Longimicrobiaceae bacterium]